MSNIPILPNNTTASSKTNNPSKVNTSANDEASQNAQPFGEVLARQLSDKNSVDSKDAKADAKLLETIVSDVAIVAATDPMKVESSVDIVATTLPSDMLAAMAATNLPPQPSVLNSEGSLATDPLKRTTNAPDLTMTVATGEIALKVMSSIATSKETASPTDQLKGATDAPELTAGKIALKTMPSISTRKETASISDKIGADVMAFTKEVELRNKLDITLAAPSTQAATPQANLIQSMASVSPIAAQATQLVIDTPITQKQWGNDFSQKITWMVSQQDQHAELHLNPAQLGPVDVVIKVSGDQATAQFTSAHAAVREVIEQSIPKLREMLADSGIMLGNTTVSDQAPRDQRGEFGNSRQTAPSGRLLETAPSDMNDARVVTTLSRHNGMVDTFA